LTDVDFLLLGPMVAGSGRQRIDLGRPGQRLLLGLLLLEVGRPVPVARLRGLLWGDDPPANADSILHTHVSRLRRALDPARDGRHGIRLHRRGSAYVAEAAASTVDVHRFRALVERAGTMTEPAARVSLLRDALRLWRGPLLADVASDDLRDRIGAGLAELRLGALETCFDAELELGRHRRVIPELTELVEAHPTRESLVAALMLALYRDGRGGDALALYAEVRQRLADQLGIDPGIHLTRLYGDILRAEPSVAATGRDPAGAEPGGRLPAPAQLPTGTAHFVGRAGHLRELDEALSGPGVAVAVLVGTAGVGKTSLVLHWAHRARDRFPDGQLYANLGGYSAGPPTRPLDVLNGWLRALSVDAGRIPANVDEAAALYRTIVADRRMLVVLDNAASAAQVRPLLPGGVICRALVTSRDVLSGLVAVEGARRITVDLLTQAEAVGLIRRIVGSVRVAAEPDAVAEVARLCAHLPLAVRIAAAKLAEDRHRTVAGFAETMRTDHRLSALAVTGDEEAAVRVAFERSYATLPAPARLLFRLLGTLPGADVPVAAVAALVDVPPAEARRRLDVLSTAHLVTPVAAERYALHDLLRLFARELTAAEDTDADRATALARMLVWYRDAAGVAERLLRPAERPTFALETTPVAFADETAALAWLDRESVNLIDAVESAATDHPRLAWQIAAAMYGWLTRRYQRARWIALYQVARAAAVEAGDEEGEAVITGRLAIAWAMLGHTEECIAACRRAHQLRLRSGDRLGAATALLNMAAAQVNAGRPGAAIDALNDAVATAGDAPGQGHFTTLVHSNLAETYQLAGRSDLARHHYERALAVSATATGKRDRAHILISFAGFCAGTGELGSAITAAEDGRRLAEDTGDIALAAEADEQRGRALAVLGDRPAALDCLYRALATYEEIGHRETEVLRAHIVALNVDLIDSAARRRRAP
jgi:DNA-binding SARP family transcriptional activator/tetratricopeptide (TPR) repeat protein